MGFLAGEGLGWIQLTHVYGAIVSDQSSERRRQADHGRKTDCWPVAVVLELEEHVRCMSSRRQHPHRNENGEETGKMQDQNAAFNERKTHGQDGVENHREHHDRDGEQSRMPTLKPIVVVVQRNNALDDAAYHESDRGEEDLPPYGAEPAGNVAENLLVLGR